MDSGTVASVSTQSLSTTRPFWIGFATGCGAALLLGLCAYLTSVSIRSSDKWNRTALAAIPVSHEVFSLYPIPNDSSSIKWPVASDAFDFDLRNNTVSDYRLDSAQKGSVTAMLRLNNDALIDGKGVHWNLVGAGQEPPLANTSGTESDSILIPRNQSVRLVVTIDFDYTSKPQPNQEEMERFATEQMKNVAGFVLLDSARHVEIDLPLRSR